MFSNMNLMSDYMKRQLADCREASVMLSMNEYPVAEALTLAVEEPADELEDVDQPFLTA